MSSVRVMKRGKVYQYQFEIASIDGKRKYINKSGYATRQEALHEGALAYNEYYRMGKKKKQKDIQLKYGVMEHVRIHNLIELSQ